MPVEKDNLRYFKQAKELNDKFHDLLSDNNAHFRGSLNSMSLVSLSQEKPELGVSCRYRNTQMDDGIDDLVGKSIEELIKKMPPQRPTPEKKLQAWVISKAMANNEILPFDNAIKFVASEVAFNNVSNQKIVVDILGYNEEANELYIIELKSKRELGRLIEQVNNFEEIVRCNFSFFNGLLKISNDSWGLSGNIKKAIVWPHANTSPKNEFKQYGIEEYSYKGNNDYTFINHNLQL